MTLEEIIQTGGAGIIVLLILALGFIKIPKKEINIWGLIGRSLNKELLDKINNVDKKVDSVETKLNNRIQETEKEKALAARRRILDASDDIRKNGARYSEERFSDILQEIDFYEDYCLKHPEFENNRAKLSIKFLKECYDTCLKEDKFLK